MKRRAFGGLFARLATPAEPFDGKAFLRELPWQPVPLWFVLSALAGPLARAFPDLSRAVCQDKPRVAIANAALVVYTLLVPPLVTTAFYLLFGRPRLTTITNRRIALVTVSVILVLSCADGFILVRRFHEQWEGLAPGYRALRAACWK